MQHLGCLLSLLLRLGATSHPFVQPVSASREDERLHSYTSDSSSSPLLQLMRVNLDNWGSMQWQPSPLTDVVPTPSRAFSGQYEVTKRHQVPLLSLMSVNLESWGVRDQNTSLSFSNNLRRRWRPGTAIDDYVNEIAYTLDSSMGFALDVLRAPESGGQFSRLLAPIAICVACVVCCLLWHQCMEQHESDPHSKETQQDLETVDFGDGSWAQVYRDAEGEDKEALELLFRCNIISTDEFSFSSVSQEHIQECRWIAKHMLQQKPLGSQHQRCHA